MAQKKKVVSKGKAPTIARVMRGPTVAKARTGTPGLLAHPPEPCRALRLAPRTGDARFPILAWGYATPHGWTGWVETQRTVQLLPTHWSNDLWKELPAIAEIPTETVAKIGAGK